MFVCNYENGRVIFLVDYNNRDRAKALGAFWDSEKKVWFKDLNKLLSDQGNLASMVRELNSAGFELSPSAEAGIKQAIEDLGRAEELLEQRKRDHSAPQPSGMAVELFPFQKAGVAFLEPLKTAILADDMGLGKTIQSIGWARERLPVLVVCPASVKENWKREILRSRPESVVGIVKQKKIFYHGKTDLNILSVDGEGAFCPCPDWVVINYDMLGEWLAWLAEQGFKAMVVDEAHCIKNAKAQRTNNCLLLSETVPNRLCVTGTPLLNRPTELFTLLQFTGKVKKKDFFWWRKRYCELEEKTIPVYKELTEEEQKLVEAGEKVRRQFKRDENGKVITRKNVKVVGAKNSKELRAEMLPYFLRRLKSEVLTDLPDKTFSDMFVELTNREEYDAAEDDIIGYIAQTQGWEKASIAERAKFLAKLSRLRQLSVAGKVSAVRGLLDDVREHDGKKAVIFSNFVDVMKKLKAELGDEAVLYVGDDAEQSSIDEFQKNPNVRFFLTTIKKGGVGITLTESDTVIFIDLPWTPGEKDQATDRCHRIGQKNNVTVIHVIGEDTVDCMVLEALAMKEGIIKQIVDGKDDEQIIAEGNTMKMVEKMMRHKFKIS